MARAPGAEAPAAAIAYPETAHQDLVEELFGVRVADPYRWLENDVREDARVREWVAAQNRVTDAYLATLPARAAFRARMTEIYDYERYGLPRKAGNLYFYTRNDGLQNQSVLYVRDGLNGEPRLLIDPNTWSADGATAQVAPWLAESLGQPVITSVVEATLVDQTEVGAFERALRPETRLIMVETPSNPLLQLTDIAAVVELAKDRADYRTVLDDMVDKAVIVVVDAERPIAPTIENRSSIDIRCRQARPK
jgi:hypothetical protein